MTRKKEDKSVVVDTSALIRAGICTDKKPICTEICESCRLHECEMAYSAMIERHHILLLSNRVRRQYKDIARRKFNQLPGFIDRKIEELRYVYNHTVREIGEGEIEKEKRKSDKIKNLQINDKPFIELACNRADFLISEESKMGEGLNRRYTEFRQICGFEIRFPIEYYESDIEQKD